jgi:alkanesulfonate monooxygenase SsuD/methylene tetrahydromethanopterin reductase-like flavin-dependent oxidoreductase (luciferase family)
VRIVHAMRVCLMIEGQEGVTWDQWRALATTAEDAGFEALFRSDHYASLGGHAGRGSLDAWATISALAALTTRITLGTCVSPATFRHPSTLAREVVTADHVSNGRVELGLGAGWHEGEHRAHGFPFESVPERFDRLEEQLEIVRRSWDPEPFDFDGRFYHLEHANPLPKPTRRPPLIVGGAARPRSIALAQRWADEYNIIFATPEECRQRAERVHPLPLSLMTTFVIGADVNEVTEKAARLGADAIPPQWIAGTPAEIADRLHELEAAGVQRVMLQHLLHDDLAAVELAGQAVIPEVT